MGGGLMQLVAYGAQDIYLTGNPQITFFKVVYRRHTNFSMESIQQTFNGSVSQGGRQTATISRNGDLINRMYLEFLSTADGNAVNAGHSNIDSVELEIGGQRIDKQFGHWMEVWSELTEPNNTGATHLGGSMDGTKFQNLTQAGGTVIDQSADPHVQCTVPLQFWFCRNPGLSLPLIALQYHEVKLIVTWASSVFTASSEELWVDYIYLDTDERRRFAQVSHEYLIEQVQHETQSSTSAELNFNHPVKELIWTGDLATNGARTALNTGNFQLKLNGHDRFAERPASYFTQTQVWQFHSGCPVDGTSTLADDTAGEHGGRASAVDIAVYSFALKPEEHQPSGTCNFSRIDNAQLKTPSTATLNIYAVNYNVLRIMSGMGGLAYSN